MQILHKENHHWRLIYAAHEIDEPHHDVSIRENKSGALALQAVNASGVPVRSIDLRGGWLPVWYRCRGFGDQSEDTKCIVFGRARDEGDGVQVELEAIVNGRWRDTVPAVYIDRLAIATQTLRIKG